MCAITNLGVSCDLGTSPAAVCSPEVPPVVGTVTWSSSNSHCLRRKREDKRAHTELSSHPGVERVYKGQNTNGSSVSVATSSAEELWHFMLYCPGGVSGLDCSRIYWLIRGTAHHTLRSISRYLKPERRPPRCVGCYSLHCFLFIICTQLLNVWCMLSFVLFLSDPWVILINISQTPLNYYFHVKSK